MMLRIEMQYNGFFLDLSKKNVGDTLSVYDYEYKVILDNSGRKCIDIGSILSDILAYTGDLIGNSGFDFIFRISRENLPKGYYMKGNKVTFVVDGQVVRYCIRGKSCIFGKNYTWSNWLSDRPVLGMLLDEVYEGDIIVRVNNHLKLLPLYKLKSCNILSMSKSDKQLLERVALEKNIKLNI